MEGELLGPEEEPQPEPERPETFVQPGETVLLEVRRSGEGEVSAEAAVDGRRVATANLVF